MEAEKGTVTLPHLIWIKQREPQRCLYPGSTFSTGPPSQIAAHGHWPGRRHLRGRPRGPGDRALQPGGLHRLEEHGPEDWNTLPDKRSPPRRGIQRASRPHWATSSALVSRPGAEGGCARRDRAPAAGGRRPARGRGRGTAHAPADT